MNVKNVFITFVAVSMFACSDGTSEIENKEERVVDFFTAKEKKEYLEDVQKLEEKEKCSVYHIFNPAPYPEDKIKELVENSIPIKDSFTRSVVGGGISIGAYGGSGGVAFDRPLNLNPGESWRKLSAIRIRCGKYIDALQFYWRNNLGATFASEQFGKNGGIECWVYFEVNEYIRKIEIRYGKYVDGFTLYTYNRNNGEEKIYTYGQRNYGRAASTVVEPASNYQIHGFFGSFGKYIDRLGFYAYSDQLFPLE